MAKTNFDEVEADVVTADTMVVGGHEVDPEAISGLAIQANVPVIATADATAQGAAYDQTKAQSIVTLANANKAKINDLIAALVAAGVIEAA